MISKEELSELIIEYRKKNLGKIARVYPKEHENLVFNFIAKLIENKYSNIISQDEAFEYLSKRGHIFSLVPLGNRDGFFEISSGNIGVPHFLNRITTQLMHESIHKLGFEREDESFKNVSLPFKESGTELVSAEVLSGNKKYIEMVIPGLWAGYKEKIDWEFLGVNLIGQLNSIVGNQKLERSILLGNDEFDREIEEKYGEKVYVYLKERFEYLYSKEKMFWKRYKQFTNGERERANKSLKTDIIGFQNEILKIGFGNKIENSKTKEEAEEILKEMIKFSDGRLKEAIEIDGERKYIDPSFKEYFERGKEQLEQRFGKLDIDFDEESWGANKELKPTLDEVTKEERQEILLLSVDLRNMHRSPGKFVKSVKGLFKRVPSKIEEKEKYYLTSSFEDKYVVGPQSGIPIRTLTNGKKEERTVEQEK